MSRFESLFALYERYDIAPLVVVGAIGVLGFFLLQGVVGDVFFANLAKRISIAWSQKQKPKSPPAAHTAAHPRPTPPAERRSPQT